MLPYKSIIHLDRKLKTPLYIQLSGEIVQQITRGILSADTKLPGGRKMAEILGLSRRTVSLAYEELEAQGWIQIRPAQGTFVCSNIPLAKSKILSDRTKEKDLKKPAFTSNRRLDFLDHYSPPKSKRGIRLAVDTGYPDVRLAPLKELSQALHRTILSKHDYKTLNYASDFYGHDLLRNELKKDLAETRGIKVDLGNIMVTRGSLMAFTCIFQVLLKSGDNVVVGDVSFKVANNIIRIAGGNLVEIPVDNFGLDIEALEVVLKKKKIRAVFVMPHHHHPTTVSLSAERRIKLLNLAAEYGFAIIEDDYDYDFHYTSSPILPMASADQNGSVIYVGSFSKTVAPGLRTGFIIAPSNFIKEISRFSRFLDVHGNSVIEKSLASLINEGVIRRHLKKSLKEYRKRRNSFCALLKEELSGIVNFSIPEGGLAVWVSFDPIFPLPLVREKALEHGLLISRTVFQDCRNHPINAIRMGFASLNASESKEALSLLKKVCEEIYP